MGFWQGLNEATIRITEREDQKRAMQEEREYGKQEKAEERAYNHKLWMEQLGESRRDDLIVLQNKKLQDEALSGEVLGKAQAFLTRLGDVDDPRVAALANNPDVAAGLEDQIRGIEIKRSEERLDTLPLTGQTLLDYTVVQNPDTGEVAPIDIDISDLIVTGDMSDPEVYERALRGVSQTRTQPYAFIKPEAYGGAYDAKVLEPGRLVFDETVMQEAQRELAVLAQASGGDQTKEYGILKQAIDEYTTAGSPGRTYLQNEFGPTAYEILEAIDSPYIQGLKDDPLLSKYNPVNSTLSQLQMVMTDPEASPEDKARAQRLLDQLQGG